MFKRFTLLTALTIGALGASAETKTVTLFDATDCDKGRLYLGNNWGGTSYNLPADSESLKSTEASFVGGDKSLKITNDAFLSGDPDAKFILTFGWTNNGQIQLAFGEINDAKLNCIIDYTDITSEGTVLTINMSDWTGSNWNQTCTKTAQEAADLLKTNGYIIIDGKYLDVKKVEYVYNTEGGGDNPDPQPTGESGTTTITGLTKTFGIGWKGWNGLADRDTDTNTSGVLLIKPEYMPNLKAGDAVQITFSNLIHDSTNGSAQAQFVYRNAGNTKWVKAGSKETTTDGYWDVANAGPYTFEITADNAPCLLDHGLIVDGHDCTVASVKFIWKNHETKEPTEIQADPGPVFETADLWSDGENITYMENGETKTATKITLGDTWRTLIGKTDGEADRYYQAYNIPAQVFIDLKPAIKDQIRVTFANTGSEAQASFYFQDMDGEWIKRSQGDSYILNTDSNGNVYCPEYYEAIDPLSDGSYSLNIVNYRMLSALLNHGMYLDGINSTITKVELVRTNSQDEFNNTPHFIGDPKKIDNPEGTQRGFNVKENIEVTESFKRFRPRAFTNYQNGEYITIEFAEAPAEGAWMELYRVAPVSNTHSLIQNVGDNGNITAQHIHNVNGSYFFYYRPTMSEIVSFKTTGLFVKGTGLKMKSIEFKDNDNNDQRHLYLLNDWITLGHTTNQAGKPYKYYNGDIYRPNQHKFYISPDLILGAEQEVTLPDGKKYTWFDLSKLDEEKDKDFYHLTFDFPYIASEASLTMTWDPTKVDVAKNHGTPYAYFMDVKSFYPDDPLTPTDEPSEAPRRAESDSADNAAGDAGQATIPDPYTITLSADNNHPDIVLNKTQLQALRDYGVWISGQNADLASIRLRTKLSKVTAGVEEVAIDTPASQAIDYDAPYEAYRIDGSRVTDITVPGLYIIRQGDKVTKLLVR